MWMAVPVMVSSMILVSHNMHFSHLQTSMNVLRTDISVTIYASIVLALTHVVVTLVTD